MYFIGHLYNYNGYMVCPEGGRYAYMYVGFDNEHVVTYETPVGALT